MRGFDAAGLTARRFSRSGARGGADAEGGDAEPRREGRAAVAGHVAPGDAAKRRRGEETGPNTIRTHFRSILLRTPLSEISFVIHRALTSTFFSTSITLCLCVKKQTNNKQELLARVIVL